MRETLADLAEQVGFLLDELTAGRIQPLHRWADTRAAAHEARQQELDRAIDEVLARHNAELEAEGSDYRLRLLGPDEELPR